MAEGLNGRPVYGRPEFEKEVLGIWSHLRAFARSLTHNETEADDLVQDTFVKALSKWELFQPGTSIKAWLFMVMRNDFVSKKRRSWRNVWLDPEIAENTLVDKSDVANQEEVLQELCAVAPIIASLPHDQRDAVVGARYVGMSYDDLAIVLGCAVGTIKSRVSRGVDALEAGLASGATFSYDLRAWASATKKVPSNHPYYPIAKAYEEIYAFLREASNQETPEPPKSVLKVRSLDDAWRELQESGGLEEVEDLDRMMRR